MKTKEYYPKRQNVPKDEVLAKRAARKLLKKSKAPRTPKIRNDPKKNNWVETFRVPLERQTVFEHNGKMLHIRDVRHKNGSTVTVSMPKIKMDYLNWFWSNVVAQCDNLNFITQLFPNVKEQSESVGALFAAQKYCSDLQNAVVLVVADGSSPRTGFLFARFAQTGISIDPEMNPQWLCNQSLPANLQVCKCTIQAFAAAKSFDEHKHIVVVAVHAHVALDDYLPLFEDRIGTVIAIPCCVPQDTSLVPQLTNYEDFNILSPCRSVSVWSKKNS